jgi:hypothetical protein
VSFSWYVYTSHSPAELSASLDRFRARVDEVGLGERLDYDPLACVSIGGAGVDERLTSLSEDERALLPPALLKQLENARSTLEIEDPLVGAGTPEEVGLLVLLLSEVQPGVIWWGRYLTIADTLRELGQRGSDLFLARRRRATSQPRPRARRRVREASVQPGLVTLSPSDRALLRPRRQHLAEWRDRAGDASLLERRRTLFAATNRFPRCLCKAPPRAVELPLARIRDSVRASAAETVPGGPGPEARRLVERIAVDADWLDAEAALALALAPQTYRDQVDVANDLLWLIASAIGLPRAMRALVAAAAISVERRKIRHHDAPMLQHWVRCGGGSCESNLGLWDELRLILCTCSDADYDEARRTAGELRAQVPPVIRCALAYVFPDLSAWAHEDARADRWSACWGFQYPRRPHFLLAAAMTDPTLLATRVAELRYQALPYALDVIDIGGADLAAPILEIVEGLVAGDYDMDPFILRGVRAVSCVATQPVADWLAKWQRDPRVQRVAEQFFRSHPELE